MWWHYDGTTWTESAYLRENTAEGETTIQFINRTGWEWLTSIGEARYGFEVALYRREEAPRFLIALTDLNAGDMFTADREPDGYDLLARYAPLVTASLLGDVAYGLSVQDSTSDLLTDVLRAVSASGSPSARRRARELGGDRL